MTDINESVRTLSARLPELAWKLGTFTSVLNPKLLPRGLFNERLEMTPQSCIDEIHADLRIINSHKNERSARYLAERVKQKINVLVQLCLMHANKAPAKQTVAFGVRAISTRQQWLGTLEDDIAKLSIQQLALAAALIKLQTGQDSQSILGLQAEIGEVERRLTLAKETLSRATSTLLV